VANHFVDAFPHPAYFSISLFILNKYLVEQESPLFVFYAPCFLVYWVVGVGSGVSESGGK